MPDSIRISEKDFQSGIFFKFFESRKFFSIIPQPVYVSNVTVAKNRALLDGRWDKNDKKDAANVADLVDQSRCLYYELPQENLRELRSLIGFRIRLKKEEHALKMRLRNNVFAQFFPELDQLYIRA